MRFLYLVLCVAFALMAMELIQNRSTSGVFFALMCIVTAIDGAADRISQEIRRL